MQVANLLSLRERWKIEVTDDDPSSVAADGGFLSPTREMGLRGKDAPFVDVFWLCAEGDPPIGYNKNPAGRWGEQGSRRYANLT